MELQVYVKAKECSEKVSVEEFAILLAKHFTSFYPQVNLYGSKIPHTQLLVILTKMLIILVLVHIISLYLSSLRVI